MRNDPPASQGLSVITARRLSVGLVGVALMASAAFAGTPAHATAPATAAVTAVRPVCLKGIGRPTRWRRAADTTHVSDRTKDRVASLVRSESRTTAARLALAEAARITWLDAPATTPRQIVVPVYIHVIHGEKKSERRIGKWAALEMFRTLEGGYAGAQNPSAGATSIRFRLRRITISRNGAWYDAAPYSHADREMKSRLHRGRARALNVYVNRPRSGGQMLLGFSTFPWQRAQDHSMDGVTISDVSLPGGSAAGYNLGDTVVHETGHWLGLLHTFEGGCEGGDGIADTPAEASPSYKCDETSNTCHNDIYPDPADPLKTIDPPDPVHNFMDYSYDSCMNSFTPGQNDRMVAAFKRFRARH